MEQNYQPATVAVTNEMIERAKHPRDLVDLPAVAENWINTYNRCNGRSDGKVKYEREKILFVQAITANNYLMNTLPFSRYVSLMRLAISGVSLDDGEASLIPRGKACTLHIQWKGRRAQIANLPQVMHVEEPTVVYDCDCDPAQTDKPFKATRGMNGLVINDWERAHVRPEGALPVCVYVLVAYNYGIKAYLMERSDVIAIRDEYSDSYKKYVADMAAHAASQQTATPWPTGKAWKTKQDGTGYWGDIQVPMWVNREEEAWKKTMLHRLWKSVDKLPHQKYIDDVIAKELAESNEFINPYGDDPANMFEFSTDFTGTGAAKTRKPRKTAEEDRQPSPAGSVQTEPVKQPTHTPAPPPPPPPPPAPAQQPAPVQEPAPVQQQPAVPAPTPAPQPATPPPPPAPPVWNGATQQWEFPSGQAPPPPPTPPAPAPQPVAPPAENGLGNLNEPF